MATSSTQPGLRDRIRAIEARGRDRAGGEARPVDAGWARLPRRTLHEWFSPEEPALCVLSDLAGRARAAGGQVFWVGRACWPHPRVLMRSAEMTSETTSGGRGGGGSLLSCSVFLDPAQRDRLWALDLVLRSEAAAAVVADGAGLDLSHTRRLQLAAEAGRAWVALARPRKELREPSAARWRWAVSPDVASADAAHPRWRVTLRRCKDAGAWGTEAQQWTLEWRNDAGLVPLPPALADRPAAARHAG